jgi:hypothetical protein
LPNLPIFTAFFAGFTNFYWHLPDLPICMAFTNFYRSEIGILHNLGNKKTLFHNQFTEVKLGKLVKKCNSHSLSLSMSRGIKLPLVLKQ